MARLLTTPRALVCRQRVITGIRYFSAAGFIGIPFLTKSTARRRSSRVQRGEELLEDGVEILCCSVIEF